jgi:hypothetical protein
MVMRALAGLLLLGAAALPAAPAAAAPTADPPAAPSSVASSSARPRVHRAPATIDFRGLTDVTSALNAFFASVPDGSTIELRPRGRYRVDGTLELSRRHDLVLDGNGATIFAGTEGARDRSQLSMTKATGIVIRDLQIEGANPVGGMAEEAYRSDKAFQHGIRMFGARDVEIARVRITKTFGDCILLGRSPDGHFSERIWIHDSSLARNGRQGIAVIAARDVVIERNRITQTRRATIDLEPDTPADGASRIFILDNRIGPGLLRFVAAHGGGPVNDVVIAYNRLEGRDLAIDIKPPDGARRSGFYIVDNFSNRLSRGDPLRFTRLDGVVVQGNTQPILVNESVILAADVCGLSVRDNDFWEAGEIVRATGPACPTPAAAPMPSPPDLIGRTRPRSNATVTPPSSAAPGGTTTTRPAAAGSGSDTGTILRWVGVAAAALVVAAGVALLVARRRRRPGGTGTPPPDSPPRDSPPPDSPPTGADADGPPTTPDPDAPPSAPEPDGPSPGTG